MDTKYAVQDDIAAACNFIGEFHGGVVESIQQGSFTAADRDALTAATQQALMGIEAILKTVAAAESAAGAAMSADRSASLNDGDIVRK